MSRSLLSAIWQARERASTRFLPSAAHKNAVKFSAKKIKGPGRAPFAFEFVYRV
jgi:hypothetical protein